MALHEQSVGASDEWYTPIRVFDAMAVRFDEDVAAPAGGAPWVPADTFISKGIDALKQAWRGFVWMNPPFGKRNALMPWLERFFKHGDGVALVPDRTSAPWWHYAAKRADAVLFIGKEDPERGDPNKLQFIRPDGTAGTSPAQGTTLMAAGPRGVEALRNAARNGLGLLLVKDGAPAPAKKEDAAQ